MTDKAEEVFELPGVSKPTWLNLLWASLICTFGSALTFLIRWFVQSQESEFATMGHLSPNAPLFTFLGFFFWVPLFGLAMLLFSFSALVAEQPGTSNKSRIVWLIVLGFSIVLGVLGYSVAGYITQETLTAYPYAVIAGTGLVIAQKRLVRMYVKKRIAGVLARL